MPVTAAVQAEVLPGDANPLEVLRCGEHLLNELAVFVLDPPALHQGTPRFSHAIGEPVSNRLQLPQVENPRRGGDGLDAMRNLRVAETLADETGELRLEASDLPAQLQPRLALVNCNTQPVEFPLFQQSRHL